MAETSIVQVNGLTHRYGQNVVVDDVSFAVEPASLFALLGPNGSGKTTLFNILTTVLSPSAGHALIGGADVVTQRAEVRQKLGIVFQSPSLDGKLSIRENLKHQGHLYGIWGRKLHARISELLARFGLSDRARDRVDKLSGGLKRRVELSKAMLHRPEVLILDEPCTGLDPAARSNLINLLTELRDGDGVTVLLTTHFMDEADCCDSVAIVDRGKLVALDKPSALKSTIGGDVITLQTENPIETAQELVKQFGVKAEALNGTVRIELERGHELVPRLIEALPGKIRSVTVGKPTLGDVFVHLTGHGFEEGSNEDRSTG